MGELEEATAVEKPLREDAPAILSFPQAKALPFVRKLAEQRGINLSTLKGTGPGGRITKQDVDAASGRKKDSPRQMPSVKAVRKYDMYGYVERIPLQGVRKIIADHMVEAVRTAAHVSAMDEADVDKLVTLRATEKKSAEAKGIKLTFLPFIIKAVIAALKQHPSLNAALENEEIILKKYYNIGVAVATDAGLLVPVIKGADQKSILEIAKEIDTLAEKAKSRKIDLGDMKGGTFTLTNYGSIGTTFGTPILNFPESAILGLGRIYDKPVVEKGAIVIRKVLPLSLTFDHRVLDGAEAAAFMRDLMGYLADPARLLAEK